jgi:hypothetical protein
LPGLAAGIGRHADVAVGQKSDRFGVGIDHRSGFDGPIHRLFDFHGAAPFQAALIARVVPSRQIRQEQKALPKKH